MAVDTYQKWVADGSPWKPAHPVDDLAKRLRGYGYTVYVLGNDEHLHAQPPEDHVPYSATGWPKPSPYPYVHACDVMPPTKAGLPSLAQLGAQLHADKQTNTAAWIKYMNWEPSGPNGPCYHDEWQPNHTRTSSTDRGHIHISIRSDYTTSTAAANYDPVARLRPPPPPAPTPRRQLIIAAHLEDAMPTHLIKHTGHEEVFAAFASGLVRHIGPAEFEAAVHATPPVPVLSTTDQAEFDRLLQCAKALRGA